MADGQVKVVGTLITSKVSTARLDSFQRVLD